MNGARHAPLAAGLALLVLPVAWQAGRYATGSGYPVRELLAVLWLAQAIATGLLAPVAGGATHGERLARALLPALVPLPLAALLVLGSALPWLPSLAVTAGLVLFAAGLALLARLPWLASPTARAVLQGVAAAAAWSGRGLWLPGLSA